MRTVIVLVCLLLSGATLADSVRLLSVPERYWGTWALSTSQENCTIQWLTETAGAEGPIYSAHMRCSNSAAPEQTTEANRVIVPNDRGELSAGPDFRQLKVYRRCPSN